MFEVKGKDIQPDKSYVLKIKQTSYLRVNYDGQFLWGQEWDMYALCYHSCPDHTRDAAAKEDCVESVGELGEHWYLQSDL